MNVASTVHPSCTPALHLTHTPARGPGVRPGATPLQRASARRAKRRDWAVPLAMHPSLTSTGLTVEAHPAPPITSTCQGRVLVERRATDYQQRCAHAERSLQLLIQGTNGTSHQRHRADKSKDLCPKWESIHCDMLVALCVKALTPRARNSRTLPWNFTYRVSLRGVEVACTYYGKRGYTFALASPEPHHGTCR
jgi:hypothetical protein